MMLPTPPQKLIILGLTLLAFLLRAYRLDVQSYWLDEAWTLYFINLPFDRLWHLLQTEEPKPPFYYLTTFQWIRLVGRGEFSLRFFSVIFGTLAIPLTYRLGKALGDLRKATTDFKTNEYADLIGGRAFERCRVETPKLRTVGDGHTVSCHLDD